MNAQFNFQQFVSDNKGKLITFLHTDKDNSVTKFVVDVCSEYFTGKNQESDSKINGFYYFSDCKMVPNKHPLQEIFETHKNVVLCYSKMLVPTSITRIDDSFIYGVCPLIGTETTHHITSINSVLTIVNGEWKTIYTSEKEPSQGPMDKLASYFEKQNKVLNDCDKVNNTLDNLNKAFDKVFPKEQTRKDGPFKEVYPDGVLKRKGQEYNKWFNSTQKESSQKNIKYRGKPKTVEIVDEYTYPDGKEYVMVKDVTDEGRTKTLFKEYIEWL